MSTNLFSEAVPPHADSAEPRGIIAALVATFLLAVRNYLKRKAAARSEAISILPLGVGNFSDSN